MKLLLSAGLLAALPVVALTSNVSHSRPAKSTPAKSSLPAGVIVAPTITVTGQTPGPKPFIAHIFVTVAPPSALKSLKFSIAPKPGSVTRPVLATFTADYLQSRGYFNTTTGEVMLPVFGLYAAFSNSVTVTGCFTDDTTQVVPVTVVAAPYVDTCNYGNPTKLTPRTASTALSYDFIQIRSYCGTESPVVIDSDSAVRWVGTAGVRSFSSLLFDNEFYVGTPPPNGSAYTAITRINWDGTTTLVRDLAPLGVTNIHHNIDKGKNGMLVEVDTASQYESIIMEIDTAGNVLKTWNFADIISAAMTAGGDNPGDFVANSPTDWFHNNACAYRASDDTLIVSSREDFVIAVDYETGLIKWLLGDTTKKWYQFLSLRPFSLTLGPATAAPIGQHAVSITTDDQLLLFDNAQNSLNHTPAGANRSYSAARKYSLDLINGVATETWNFLNGQTLKSPFCSSVYEDAASNYLVDYTLLGPANARTAGLIALEASGAVVFDYRYTTAFCDTSWNSIPIHMENMLFTGPVTKDFKITSVTNDPAKSVITFPAVAGNTYRFEYKDDLTAPNWSSLGDFVIDCSGLKQLTDLTSAGQPQRSYRVRLLAP